MPRVSPEAKAFISRCLAYHQARYHCNAVSNHVLMRWPLPGCQNARHATVVTRRFSMVLPVLLPGVVPCPTASAKHTLVRILISVHYNWFSFAGGAVGCAHCRRRPVPQHEERQGRPASRRQRLSDALLPRWAHQSAAACSAGGARSWRAAIWRLLYSSAAFWYRSRRRCRSLGCCDTQRAKQAVRRRRQLRRSSLCMPSMSHCSMQALRIPLHTQRSS